MSARRRSLPLLDPVVTVAVILVVGSAAGCTSDIGSSGDQGFVSGQGIITVVAEAERSAPGEVAGETIDGEPLSLADYAGQIVVVNVWGSWCVPCRTEAPMLAKAARDLESEDVAFLGIDSRDPSESAARAFVRTFDTPYPSIYDQEGRTLLAFRGTLTPSSIPSTVVIDREGRVAASVLGEITRTTLDELVEEAS
ncbi:MAG: TlpA family protein disulfide reductase [Nocardioidaceae bacterium]|nr:TlpA family protein disulfide reductase [Nocardioidaceae bacterium]